MTPITGITEEDLQIATAIEEALATRLESRKRMFTDCMNIDDILRAVGLYAALDPEFRVRYVQAAKDAGLIP